jgi:NADH dehydrogenase
MKHVVVVGGGFGGLRVVRHLADAPVRITLLNRRNYHLFQPLLYQVATAGLGPTDIAHSLRSILKTQRNVDIRLTEVTNVDFAGKTVMTDSGPLTYDYLVLAVGGETNFYGMNSIAEHAFGLKDLDDAENIRNHVLGRFERAVQESDPLKRRALLTFVVVGGGPTGVECAGALSELFRLVLIRDYHQLNIKDVRIVLLENGDRLLAGFPDRLRATAEETLWRKYVEVRFGAGVCEYDGTQVLLKSGERIPAQTLVWAAGVRAERLTSGLGVELDRLKRIRVQPTLQLPGHPEVFAIGDCAQPEGAGQAVYPMIGPVAIQQAEAAATNIWRLLADEPLEPFRYRDPGSMATIGRNAAVVRLGPMQLTGFPAWLIWLVVHIAFLIGFRNRLLVLINWSWDYFFFDRAVRLITSEKKL